MPVCGVTSRVWRKRSDSRFPRDDRDVGMVDRRAGRHAELHCPEPEDLTVSGARGTPGERGRHLVRAEIQHDRIAGRRADRQ